MDSLKNCFFSLDHFGIIACTGADCTRFLQGQLTCDIDAIPEDSGNLTALCNIKGRVKAVLWVFKLSDAYLLALPVNILADTLASLNKYAVFSKVDVVDASEDYQLWGLHGSMTDIASPAILAKQALAPIDERALIISKKTDHAAIMATLKQHGISGDLAQWQQADIEAHIPWITAETAEKFTPHMLNLPQLNAVSFTKGCYLGQEIIARTEYRGKTKRGVKQLTVEYQTPLQPGDTLPTTVSQDLATVLQSIQINHTLQTVLVVG